MATFAGRTSPTALAALAPSITNLAAAQRAKSQAAAGLMNTLGVQFEKQKEQEARKQKNQAAQQVAEGLLKDEAFRRQVPGISTSADLVKLVGAENVIEYGMKSQQADRLAQQSAAQIALTKKQIDQYDIDAKQREAEEASSKALTTLVGGMYGEGFTQEDLMTGLQGLSSSDAVRALNIYNERNPQDPLQEIKIGDRTYIYSKKTGNASLVDGSKLTPAAQAQLAAIEQMDIPEEEKERRRNIVLEYISSGGVDDLGNPLISFEQEPEAAGPVFDVSPEATSFFGQIPEKNITNLYIKDGQTTPEFDQYLLQLAKAGVSNDIINGVKTLVEQRAKEQRMGRFARGEFGEEKQRGRRGQRSVGSGTGGNVDRFAGGTGVYADEFAGGNQMPMAGEPRNDRVLDAASEVISARPISQKPIPSEQQATMEAKSGDSRILDLAEAFMGRGRNMGQRGGPSSRVLDQGRGVMEIVGSGRLAASQPPELGGPNVPMVRPSARVPAVVTGQPGPGIGGGMEATGQGRVAAAQQIGERVRLSEGPLARGVMEVLGPQIKAVGERIDETLRANRTLKEEQATFKRAKELAKQEILKTYNGKDRDQILKEVEKARLNRIKQIPKTSAQTKAQQKMHEVLMYMLNMEEAPMTSYGDPRMQSQPLLPVE